MKILIAHNSYQLQGGEDAVVDAEIALLRAHGHEVRVHRRHNDELHEMSRAAAALTTIWSRQSASTIKEICQDFHPDVIHVHNSFPLISPSLYWIAARGNVPVIQTLHNFRLLCPQAIFLRNEKICEDCMGKFPWRAVTRKCYRGSALQSAVITGMLGVHRILGTYQRKITRYIALNTFCRDKLVQGGLPEELFRIKPNFIDSAALPDWRARHGGLFVGRLSSEKGLDVLATAVNDAGLKDIDAIGSGPLAALATGTFGERYLGFLPLEDIIARMRSALFLIVPSICYESFPRTIVEAFACGLPVIASRLGALPDLVRDGVTGLLFDPGDAADLAAKITWAQSNPEKMLAMGRTARAEYEEKYTPQRNYQTLIDIYDEAIIAVQGERDAA